MKFQTTISLLATSMLLACASRGPVAPVVERTVPPQKAVASGKPEAGPKRHIIKQGDTLYSIALDNGLDYKELASWNQLADVNLIKIGESLLLSEPLEAGSPNGSEVIIKPLKAVAEPAATDHKTAASPPLLAYPKALKLSHTADAATVERQAEGPGNKPAGKPLELAGQKPEIERKASASPVLPVPSTEEEMVWAWPTTGKVIANFSEGAKGIDISGKLGQPVLSASSGKVMYAGSGLRGYGNLIIIKHNKTYLSAYAHNSRLIVKEGESVKKGDKIAEMGSSDAEQVKLHFEIRRFGKPVDPSKYLTAG